MTMLSHSKLLLGPTEISMFEPQLWVFALKQKTFCLFLLTGNCFLSREKQGWKEKVLISSCERCWPSSVMTVNLSINVYTSSLLWNGFPTLNYEQNLHLINEQVGTVLCWMTPKPRPISTVQGFHGGHREVSLWPQCWKSVYSQITCLDIGSKLLKICVFQRKPCIIFSSRQGALNS